MKTEPDFTARPVKRKKAYQGVADELRSMVLTGKLNQGQRLPPERELAKHFGVSRVVLREAIRTLETAGLLKVREGAGGGTFVHQDLDKPLATSINNLLMGGSVCLPHLFELRLLLEPPAAALAASRRTEKDLNGLKKALGNAEKVRGDPQALRQANFEFHRRIVAMADNPLLSVISDTVIRILAESLRGKPGHKASLSVLESHHRVYRAVRDMNPEQTQRLLEEDLTILFQKYREMGVEVGFPSTGFSGGGDPAGNSLACNSRVTIKTQA